jgi:hypothetical protein
VPLHHNAMLGGIMDPIAIGIIGLCIVLVMHVPLRMEWM